MASSWLIDWSIIRNQEIIKEDETEIVSVTGDHFKKSVQNMSWMKECMNDMSRVENIHVCPYGKLIFG